MTPVEWATSTDPLALVRYLRGRPVNPLTHWFGLVLSMPPPPCIPKLCQLLDAICDHPPTEPDSDATSLRQAVRSYLTEQNPVPALATLLHAVSGIEPTAVANPVYDHLATALLIDDRNNPPLTTAIRCLYANPSSPLPNPFPWRSDTAILIASGIESDGALDRLPVLADALEDAGCDHAALLDHLRSVTPHRPGCHVLDAVLGR